MGDAVAIHYLRFFFSWGLTLTAASIGGAVAFFQPTLRSVAYCGSKCHPFIWVCSECRAGRRFCWLSIPTMRFDGLNFNKR